MNGISQISNETRPMERDNVQNDRELSYDNSDRPEFLRKRFFILLKTLTAM